MCYLPQKYTNQKAVFCNSCNFYIHLKCNDILFSDYKRLENEPEDVAWSCKKCTMDIFPFGSLADDEFLVLLFFDLPSFVNSIPSLP